MIDVTGVPLRSFANAVFSASGGGTLLDADYEACLVPTQRATQPVLIMTVVAGIACHMAVIAMFGRQMIRVHWPDHTDDQLRAMLTGLGVPLLPHAALGHQAGAAKRPMLAVAAGVI